ncbi:MAG: RagB/SusD family nutrient uptake outer membrane protein [Bacteroides sp.]|nr:RagB/SusD family nutrient uptake outer membrane protein [Bacteroides sp.]
MKTYFKYIGCLFVCASLWSCDSFLDRDPYDQLTNDSYWIDEVSLRAYAQDFYSTYFLGYGTDYTVFGGYFSGDSYNDDFLLIYPDTERTNRLFFPTTNVAGVNASATVWTNHNKIIRKANIMLEEIPDMDIDQEAKNHWMGVARFFRAMAYTTLVKAYGDVPYIDTVVDPADEATLYKDRDSKVLVIGKIQEDYEYAAENVRSDDGNRQVHKYLVAAMMSRDMLYHATWLKYHGTTIGSSSQKVSDEELRKFFQAAIDGAQTVMNSNVYAIGNTYNALFSSESLAGNPEIIFYREYATGVQGNSLMSYNALEPQEQGGVTMDAVNSYLCLDGLPIGQSPLYNKDDIRIQESFKDRDPRLYETIVDSLRIMNSGLFSAVSPTGFVTKKFLNEEWLEKGLDYTTGIRSPADAPIIRYAEVLLNYVEARYEISTIGGTAFTQEDLDKSINQIRKRQLTKWGESPTVVRTMPAVTLSGNSLIVHGTVIDDPDRDMDVDPILWEIRRERRTELMMEGRRGDDLKRWGKFVYLNSGDPSSLSLTILGAWIDKADYPGISEDVVLYNPEDNSSAPAKGYIHYYNSYNTALRVFNEDELTSERNYLRAVPAAQITTYKDKGYTLTQNPGWE